MSRPDDWRVYINQLADISTDGKTAIQSALQELKKFGYARLEVTREGNRATGKQWVILETPEDGSLTTGFSDSQETQTIRKPAPTNNEGKNENDLFKEKDLPVLEKELVSEWNRMIDFNQVRGLTGKRAVALRQRSKEKFFREHWREAVSKVAASQFCRGETGSRGWKANIDWFLRPDTVVKIMEGQYSNGKEAARRRPLTDQDYLDEERRP